MSLNMDCAVYTTEAIPDHPGAGWTRFVCVSDTHSRIHMGIPAGDVFIHAGDLTKGTLEQLKTTVDWIKSLKHGVKIVIAGNHDECLDKSACLPGRDWRNGESVITAQELHSAYELVRGTSAKAAGLNYLEHEPLVVSAGGRSWKLFGSPAAPRYSAGAFQYSTRKEAENLYDDIPDDTEILLTHTPALNTLDETRKGKHAGCPVLADRLKSLQNCRLHVCGHIHEAHGAQTSSKMVSVNAALQFGAKPVVVDLRHLRD